MNVCKSSQPNRQLLSTLARFSIRYFIMLVFAVNFCLFLYPETVLSRSHLSTNELWSSSNHTYYRPAWAGNVDISYDNAQIRSVSGVVVPMLTSGRPEPPRPYNKFPTGTDVHLDRGHVMALSNGGPNIDFNIVPQDSLWQETGGWREFEEVIFKHALYEYGWSENNLKEASQIANIADPGNHVKYTVYPSEYSTKTGEPMRYKGSVHTGSRYYHFTIKPDSEVQWRFNRAPPSEEIMHTQMPWIFEMIRSTEIHDDDQEEDELMRFIAYIGIVVSICLVVIGVTCCALTIRRKQRRKSRNMHADVVPYEQML